MKPPFGALQLVDLFSFDADGFGRASTNTAL
jgi:hypothetical protein